MPETLIWKQEYELGIKSIDEQHKKFLAILARFLPIVGTERMKSEWPGILSDLEVYAEEHFATEEKYFDKFAYPDADKHKTEHQAFRNKLNDIEVRMKDGTLDYFQAADFFEDWLIFHITSSDRQYAPFFKEQGLS